MNTKGSDGVMLEGLERRAETSNELSPQRKKELLHLCLTIKRLNKHVFTLCMKNGHENKHEVRVNMWFTCCFWVAIDPKLYRK